MPPTPPPHLRKSPPEIAAAGKAAKGGDDSVDVAEAVKDDDNAPKKKMGRTNWGKEPHRGELKKAIDDYLNKTGNALDSNGEEIKDVYLYAGLVGIPFSTLYRYICPAEDKRRILGNGERGKKKLISNDNIQFIGETFTRLDRANDGASRQEGTDYLMSTVPNLSRAQALRQLTRVVLPKYHKVGLLKKTVQKVQETTSDRIAISLPQQIC